MKKRGFLDPESGQRIVNPFMDCTGRFEVDPYEHYTSVCKATLDRVIVEWEQDQQTEDEER
jgi:hypothetical protein